MPYGYHDRILRVDLSRGKLSEESLGVTLWRRYLGGRALAAHFLAQELAPDPDPLGPENVLVFAPGVVTGAMVSGQGRNGIAARSPLTGGLASSEVGGYWGSELRRAGYDAIVVTGRAPAPVYLWVHDGQAELRDATHLWGLDVGPAEDALQAAHGGKRVRTCLIGPAGENQVRFAAVVNDRSHFAGRGGLGAVMGAKNLKGVAVLAPTGGAGLLELADKQTIIATQQWLGQNPKLYAHLHEHGTAGGVVSLAKGGGLPTHNFQAGSFSRAAAISGATMTETILQGRDTCAACTVRCKRVVGLEEPYKIDPAYGGPEYETLAALGSNCGVGDLAVLAKLNERCAALGLDTISTGAVIAFAFECAAHGLLDAAGDGLTLAWGEGETVLALVERIARRQGLGDLLADGVARAAARIGQGAADYALHVKGQELPMHEPRVKHGLGLGYAVSPTGADHMHNMHDSVYTRAEGPLQRMQVYGEFAPVQIHGFDQNKVRLFATVSSLRHALDCMVMCHFLPYSPQQQAALVQACTGWDLDCQELLSVGRRAATMARMINLGLGLSQADDNLPGRLFRKLDASSMGQALEPAALTWALGEYYRCMGWSDDGVPTPQTLANLDIAWMNG